VNHETLFSSQWLGTIEPNQYLAYIDNYLLMMLGGVPYQVNDGLLIAEFR
jgi:hypothetical protein